MATTAVGAPVPPDGAGFFYCLFDSGALIVYYECMRTMYLQSAVWKEGKFYVAQCLNIDVSSFGKTKKEALKNLQEALELYFEDENIKPSKIASVEKPELTKLSVAYA